MKNRNQIYLFIFVIFIFPFFSFGIDGSIERKQFGQYKVLLSHEYESGNAKIEIKKGEIKVFEEEEIDNHYSFGNKVLGKRDRYSGRDLTGNGFPNLVIVNWNGGAHCCNFLHIFELGKNFKKLVTVEAGSSSIRLVDLDHDGFPEIEFWDGAIDYQFASFAGSPSGRVVLKFRKDHYEIATDLMKKPKPSDKQLRIIKNKIKTAFERQQSSELPYEFLNFMMESSYTGHFDLALKIVDEVWPKNKFGMSKFKEDFTQALRESSYWKYF